MTDIVIDTNVLVHTQNVSVCYNKSSIEILTELEKSPVKICVDDVFSLDSTNTSVIGSEYIKHIRYGTMAYGFVLSKLLKKQYTQIIKKDYSGIKKEFRKKVRNQHDVTFLLVTYGSDEKCLITNDYNDFTDDIRDFLASGFGLILYDSSEFNSIR